MAASTTLRPHSSNSSGSSTPWLSPEPASTTWRHSYTSSTDLRRRTSTASPHLHAATTASAMNTDPSTSSSSSSRDAHSQEWWEHVLPPGQLAERLRKAQRSTSASRRRNNPALANATPSERSAWKRLSGLPTEKHQHERSESSTATSSRRSSFQSGASSAATVPRSAMRSSHRSHDAASVNIGNLSQSESSAEVSSDEFGGSSTRQHSPQNQTRFAFPSGERDSATPLPSRRPGIKTTGNSPDLVSSSSWTGDAFDSSRSISRSSGGRRKRVMSEDGIASSFFASTQSSSSSSSSYRLPGSHSAVHLSQLASISSETTTWTTTPADRARAKYTHHSLPDTPELSSEDDGGADVTSFSATTTAQRVRKISTTKTIVRTSSGSASSSNTTSPPTILRSHFDRPEEPPSHIASDDVDGYISPPGRRDRHVSFDQATEIPRRASVQDWSEPMTSSQSTFSFGSLPGRDHASPFDSLPPRSNSTRQPRQGVCTSGRRTTSFSLPGSRRGSIRGDSPFQFHASTAAAEAAAAGSQDFGSKHRRAGSIPDVVLLESLNVAHKQLASAGNLALTLTRQLSAPLRPVFHMTLFLSISSITVLSLACFLCASYMLTAWDDVSKRTHKVGEVAGRTKHRFERTLDWGFRMLAPTEGSSSSRSGGEGRASSGKARADGEAASGGGAAASSSGSASGRAKETEKRGGPVRAAGHALLWPARMAFSGATMVAHTLTPPVISNMFSGTQQRDRPGPTKKSRTGSTLPPRPPLSTLLPSILFTLLLAIGAGLTSFLASRRAAAEAASAPASSGAAGARAYSVPLSGSSPDFGGGGMAWGHFGPSSTTPSSASASPFVGARREAHRRTFVGGMAEGCR
ncbi:conserved hypothetical protein [Sporisorium reilianum SRZ2]|uniref:Uncharacterized protein n=1 Tax=Sporisorium reilianum (strain SRZ2) TaxID=999809 RepID=E6ZRP3_SPORE|nr:conserved hypothetical protein [Sporisorium reilianum SRZ2]